MSCTFWNLRRRKKALTASKEVKPETKVNEKEKPTKKGGVKDGK